MILMNEKIKAKEVELTGLDGEALGVMAASEALAMAKRLKVDLVCTSLMSSPPPCRLVAQDTVKREQQQERKKERPSKVKELRLNPQIEDHDLDTKKLQAERILKAGDSVLLIVAVQGKNQAASKTVLEALLKDLKPVGKPQSGIQLSGKQAAVQVNPL